MSNFASPRTQRQGERPLARKGGARPAAALSAAASQCLATALNAVDLGFSPIPPAENGSKAPLADLKGPDGKPTWKPYQDSPATTEHVRSWYAKNRTGVGLVTGYAGLEGFEFDDRETYERFLETAEGVGLSALVNKIRAGYEEETPGGGIHWLYFADEVRGNTRLAARPQGSTVKTLIETRGDGGYMVIAPSCGKVHPSGKPYRLLSGGLDQVVSLSHEEREMLWDLARSLDETPVPEKRQPKAREPRRDSDELKPGDDYEAKATWEDVLIPYGWRLTYERGDLQFWTRPGKEYGVSASTGRSKNLKVFSTSTPLSTEGTHSKFDVYATLAHGGNYSAAARELRRLGYGSEKTKAARKEERAVARSNATVAAQEIIGDPNNSTKRERPVIELTTERHIVRDQAIAAIALDDRLFSKGDMLAVSIKPTASGAKLTGGVDLRNASNAPRIVPLDEPNLGCFLTENAKFFKWGKDRNGEDVTKDSHPPDWLIASILSKKSWDGVRPLVSIAECPYVRPNGVVVSKPGYDPEYLALMVPTFEVRPIPDRLTRSDAAQAAKRIKSLVRQFPFASEDDFNVWLTALITAIQRPVISGPTPGFAFNGNKAGCGKGMLIDAIGLLVWGSCIPTVSYPRDPAESDKVALSLALAGVQAVHYDNLAEGRFYGDESLDSALTSTIKGGRVLGLSKMVEGLPLRPLWCLSGNNISPAADAYRRWLPSNLKTDLERPHERDDIEIADLKAHIAVHRSEIIRDALIVIKAHAMAGSPGHGKGPLGSFVSWDNAVRTVIKYATDADCLATQRAASEEAPDRVDKLALLEAWASLPDGRANGYTAQEVISHASGFSDEFSFIRSVLMRMGRKGELPDSRVLGTKLRGMKGENIGGKRFIASEVKRHQAVVWVVQDV